MEGYYSTDATKPNTVYKDENVDLKMPWTAAPSYMKNMMPTREDPRTVYLSFKKVMLHSTKEVNAEGITSVIRRFADAFDPVEYMDYRTYAFNVALDIEKRKAVNEIFDHYSQIIYLFNICVFDKGYANHNLSFQILKLILLTVNKNKEETFINSPKSSLTSF